MLIINATETSGRRSTGTSQKTCRINYFIQLSGERLEDLAA
jgi:hypothetical protein